MCVKDNPANTKDLYIICTKPAQRLRRWSNIVQMIYKSFVFAVNHDGSEQDQAGNEVI